MKRLSLILALAIILAGGAIGTMSAPAQAQYGYNYPPPPQNIYATPWVGPNTPWVYYQGDWFLNGILHNFFGNQYGWAPYYAYPPTYIVRPKNWYAPKWHTWYQRNPHYWQNFKQQYPYWAGHKSGRHYDQNFYNRYHHGQGEGGIKDSMASVLPEMLVMAVRPLKPMALRGINLEKILTMRENIRTSSPTGAGSQIAQPGRSGTNFADAIKVSHVWKEGSRCL